MLFTLLLTVSLTCLALHNHLPKKSQVIRATNLALNHYQRIEKEMIDLRESKVKIKTGKISQKKLKKQNMIWLMHNYSDVAKCYDLKLKAESYNSNRN